LSKEENSAKSRNQQQSDSKRKGPSADVNMVFMLPMEFLVPFGDDEEVDFSDQTAQLALDPMTAVFEKPTDNERQHLKALFVKGRVDGQPMTKILVDGGAAINIMPYAVYRKLGKRRSGLNQDRYDAERLSRKCVSSQGSHMCRVDYRQQNLADNFLCHQRKGCL
jgi:hypothetical protein